MVQGIACCHENCSNRPVGFPQFGPVAVAGNELPTVMPGLAQLGRTKLIRKNVRTDRVSLRRSYGMSHVKTTGMSAYPAQ